MYAANALTDHTEAVSPKEDTFRSGGKGVQHHILFRAIQQARRWLTP
jgi:hypothetical protein